MKTKVIVVGLGMIGRAIARAALQSQKLEMVAAVDPLFAGQALADLIDSPQTTLQVLGELAEAARLAPGGIVLHATGSYIPQVQAELEACARARLHVVSTCEELSYPWINHPDAAKELDAVCKDFSVAILGTGVNPGFVFERLSSLLSHACGLVKSIEGLRAVDTRTRRAALQRKTGAGLSLQEFRTRVSGGGFGHVGLRESAVLTALGCGLGVPDRVTESIDPVVADRDIEAAETVVRVGEAAGIHQVARAYKGEQEIVTLDLTIAVGTHEPRDEVTVHAGETLKLIVQGGTPGDTATAYTAIHAAEHIASLRPGLRTVLDLPAGRAYVTE